MEKAGSKVVKSKYGDDVVVEHARKLTKDTRHTILISAKCGSSEHSFYATFGAVDGPRPELPTQEKFQALLDADRQSAADHASFKEHVKLLLDKIE